MGYNADVAESSSIAISSSTELYSKRTADVAMLMPPEFLGRDVRVQHL